MIFLYFALHSTEIFIYLCIVNKETEMSPKNSQHKNGTKMNTRNIFRNSKHQNEWWYTSWHETMLQTARR